MNKGCDTRGCDTWRCVRCCTTLNHITHSETVMQLLFSLLSRSLPQNPLDAPTTPRFIISDIHLRPNCKIGRRSTYLTPHLHQKLRNHISLPSCAEKKLHAVSIATVHQASSGPSEIAADSRKPKFTCYLHIGLKPIGNVATLSVGVGRRMLLRYSGHSLCCGS